MDIAEERENPTELLLKLHSLNEIGIALSKEKNRNKLLETILFGAKELTNADAGTIYLIDNNKLLQFEMLYTTSMDFKFNREKGGENPFQGIPLYKKNGSLNDKLVASYAALHDKSVNIDDVYQENNFDFSGTKKFDKKSGYRCKSLIAVPMKDHEDTVIGVLQLINAIDSESKKVCCFSKKDEHLLQSLASQAAVFLSQKNLIKDLRDTFEGFVQAIGEAIDKKSIHTSKHCQRVPIITMMLADAVNNALEGPYKDFQMNSDELYELKIAALLHDCGKVATPVHIIDKATKLQTICDRIELIETRVELLKSQIRLKILQGDEKDKSEWELDIKELSSDMEFLRQANTGNIIHKDEDLNRLEKIASKTWVCSSGEQKPLLTKSELENLQIPKGTLNNHEREIINNHVVTTIDMLKYLPLPKDLLNVPEIAGAHHEHIDGSGYPNHLKGDNMSPQAKILAIADVFEALTASDRAYKAPLKLSKVVSILESMMESGHLDPDLGHIFLEKGLPKLYATKHLDKDQIDL